MNLLPALVVLEQRAKGDYEPDELPKSFPQFVRPNANKATGQTPIGLFEEWVLARKPEQSTIESWRTVFNSMTRDFPDRSASSITADEAQAWIDSLVTADRSARTVSTTWIRASKRIYAWAVKRRKLTNNPFSEATIEVPRRETLRPKSFYRQEMCTILRAASAVTDCDNPDLAARRWAPWLLAYTGARPQGITQLRGSDVQFFEECWTVNLTPEAGTSKSGGARRVPLHDHLIDQGLLEFVRSKGQGPLFYRPRKQAQSDDLLKRRKSPAAQGRQRLAAWVREIGVTTKGTREHRETRGYIRKGVD